MKEFYEIPVIEVIDFEVEDIIKTSTIWDDELPSDIFKLTELEEKKD